jgi:hypothetical protein
MRNPVFFTMLLLLILGLSACAKPPVKAAGSPDEQRSHAERAQDELSTEVKK